jgi:hypothetical protein
VRNFPGDDPSPRFRSLGTARFAAAIQVDEAKGQRVLATRGFERDEGWQNPELPPGYRVTKYGDETLSGRAMAFRRLPVVERTTDLHVRSKVAIRPIDLILAAYEDYGEQPLPTPRETALDSDPWAWLFEPLYPRVLRRKTPGLPLVTARGRGVRWADLRLPDGEGVRRGDILLIEDDYALLQGDDGDEWLGGGDNVLHVVTGEVREGKLQEIPGRSLRILRCRDFAELRANLRDAGYGDLGGAFYYGPDVQRACREYQRDRGIAATGVPDSTMLSSLIDFLATMRSYDEVEVDEERP